MRAISRLLAVLVVALTSAALAQGAPPPLQLNLGGTANDRSGTPIRTLFQQVQGNFNAILSARGAPGGFAALDQSGRLPTTQLPPISLTLPNGGSLTQLTLTGAGSTGDVSGMSVTPQTTAPAGTLAKLIADKAPSASPAITGPGSWLEGMATSPSATHGGLVFQNTTMAAGDILGPQQPPTYFTVDGVRSSQVNLPDSTAQTTSAFGGYVANRSTRDATGIFTTCAQVVDNGPCWGGNLTMIDAPANGAVTNGVGRRLIGLEINPTVTSAGTTVQGISILGSSQAQPAYAAGMTIGHLNAGQPGVFRWNNAFVVSDGSALTGYLTGAQQITGSNIPGIQNLLNYRDASGAAQAVTYAASGSGALNIGGTSAANGVTLQPVPAGQFPVIQAFGSDTNTGLVLQAQGLGQVVTQSVLNAAKGFYGATSAQFAVPVRLFPQTVSALQTTTPCGATNLDAIAVVTDAASPTYRGALTGGGTTRTLAYCDGGNWTTH